MPNKKNANTLQFKQQLTPHKNITQKPTKLPKQCDVETERILNHSASDIVILFRDIITPDAEVLRGEDELHLRFQAVHIDSPLFLTPAVLHILKTATVADATEGILRWVRENPEAHALKLFDIYDNLYCIMSTKVNNKVLPPSLRLSRGTANEGEFLKEPQTISFVERYLEFLDTFWLPLVASDDATMEPIMRLLETKHNVGYESTTSTAVFCMKHGLGVLETRFITN
jgi:hypothetical protein